MSLSQPDPETISIREAIACKAKEALVQGAHYLTGCYGAYPESCDPVVGRALYLIEDPGYANVGVHTAEIRMPKLRRCAGRFAKVQGRRLDDSAGRRLLRNYASENCGRTPGRYSSVNGLYPRFAHHSVTGEKWHVLGESCLHKLHFDCIGLVNWAVSQTIHQPLKYGIQMWADSDVAPVEVEEQPFSELLPGDILVRLGTKPEHIALAGPEGELIEAAGFDTGVIDAFAASRERSTERYHKHCRIKNGWLLNPVLSGAG